MRIVVIVAAMVLGTRGLAAAEEAPPAEGAAGEDAASGEAPPAEDAPPDEEAPPDGEAAGEETPPAEETPEPPPEETPAAVATPTAAVVEPPAAEVEPPAEEEQPAEPDPEALRYADQLAEDSRPIPDGMGAIFVPAMTDPTLEPAVDVYSGGRRIDGGRVAHQIFVPPGHYIVRVGRGNERIRPMVEVDVTAGEVSLVTPTWAALVIDVVDDHNIPHRGSYDMIRLDTREAVGTGRGADRRTGEGLRTWLLIPGNYKVVRPGGTYRERIDFATVRVDEGQTVHFVLVMEPSTGAFRGAGVVPEEQVVTGREGFTFTGTVGGSLSLNHHYQSPVADDGVSFGGDIFADFDLHYDEGLHYFSSQLQLEAGGQYLPGGELRKTLDYFDFAALYVLQLHEVIGPYVRFGYNSSMMPGFHYFEDPEEVTYLDVDGELIETLPNQDRVRLGPSFALNDFREGVGANVRAVRSYWLDLDIRLGIGFQQLVASDLRALRDDEETEALEYQDVADFTHREGIDFGLMAAGSLTGWISYSLEFGLLEPFTDLENPVIDLDVTITLRLWSIASLNYLLRVRRDIVIAEDVQVDQAVLLRFAWNMF